MAFTLTAADIELRRQRLAKQADARREAALAQSARDTALHQRETRTSAPQWVDRVVIEAVTADNHADATGFITSAWMEAQLAHKYSRLRRASTSALSLHERIRTIFGRPSARALICRDIEHTQVYYAFLVYEWAGTPDSPVMVVHFVYSKQRFRRFKFAKAMFEQAGWLPGMEVIATSDCRLHYAEGVMQKFNITYDDNFILLRST